MRTKQDAIALVMSPFQKAMRKLGMTEEYRSKKLKSLISAKKIEVFKGTVKKFEEGEKGRVFVSEEREEVIYSKPLAALDIRLKALQEANKMAGDAPAMKHEVGGPGGRPLVPEISKEERDLARMVSKAIMEKIVSGEKSE